MGISLQNGLTVLFIFWGVVWGSVGEALQPAEGLIVSLAKLGS